MSRERPDAVQALDVANGGSFPSGHVIASTVVLGAILILFARGLPAWRRTLAIVSAAVFVILVAMARLALGVHYLTDVIAGLVLGLAWVATSSATFAI